MQNAYPDQWQNWTGQADIAPIAQALVRSTHEGQVEEQQLLSIEDESPQKRNLFHKLADNTKRYLNVLPSDPKDWKSDVIWGLGIASGVGLTVGYKLVPREQRIQANPIINSIVIFGIATVTKAIDRMWHKVPENGQATEEKHKADINKYVQSFASGMQVGALGALIFNLVEPSLHHPQTETKLPADFRDQDTHGYQEVHSGLSTKPVLVTPEPGNVGTVIPLHETPIPMQPEVAAGNPSEINHQPTSPVSPDQSIGTEHQPQPMPHGLQTENPPTPVQSTHPLSEGVVPAGVSISGNELQSIEIKTSDQNPWHWMDSYIKSHHLAEGQYHFPWDPSQTADEHTAAVNLLDKMYVPLNENNPFIPGTSFQFPEDKIPALIERMKQALDRYENHQPLQNGDELFLAGSRGFPVTLTRVQVEEMVKMVSK